jgi:nicotinate-nucleotide pyrophosphorylase (carboxylating)
MMSKRNKTMKASQLPVEVMDTIIDKALSEDTGRGDITSEALIPPGLQGEAYILIKEKGILAGIEVAQRTLQKVDSTLNITILIPDGTEVNPGDIAMRISGNVHSLLKAERVTLNFLQRLSGIASTTARFVALVEGLGVDIADTRKTTPGLRVLEKYAVRMGGGRNHRMDLSDAVLIKDNHFAALRLMGLSYREIVAKAKKNVPKNVKVEAEATTIQEAVDAVEAGADIVMLDNMPLEEMSRAVKLINGRVEVEGSGSFNLSNIRAAAETGVDFISVGALTHSYKSLDISLEIEIRL